MKNYLKTVLAYSKKVSTTGALFETSAMVVREMCKGVQANQPQNIVELGAGHGNITEGILARMHPQSRLLSFELHADFCNELSQRISDSRLSLINDSAANLQQHLQGHQLQSVDLVISALPLVLFPDDMADNLLRQIQQSLTPNGTYVQVSYSLMMQKQLKRAFTSVDKKMVVLNMPPAFVFRCSSQPNGK